MYWKAVHVTTVGSSYQAGKQDSFLSPALIQLERHYVGLSKAAALWEWGQRSSAGLQSLWAGRHTCLGFGHSCESNGVNGVSMSGVAETHGSRFSLWEEDPTNTERNQA